MIGLRGLKAPEMTKGGPSTCFTVFSIVCARLIGTPTASDFCFTFSTVAFLVGTCDVCTGH